MDAKLLAQIKTQFRRHMNGTTASLMRQMDNSYKTNYGLSLQHVREVAAMFTLSPEDCDELWDSRWREMMLVALCALGADRADAFRLYRWAATVPNQEMAENFAFLLSGRCDFAISLCRELAIRNEGFDLALAAHTAGRVVAAGISEGIRPLWEDGIGYLFALGAAQPDLSSAAAAGLGFLARQCLRKRVALSAVEAFVAYASSSSAPALVRVAQEYAAEKELFG